MKFRLFLSDVSTFIAELFSTSFAERRLDALKKKVGQQIDKNMKYYTLYVDRDREREDIDKAA